MSELAETYDHSNTPVKHGRARVNGIRMHYITAGTGPALLLLHGTPKNSFYWYRIFPLLTPYFTLVAPDLRGFGYTDKPPSEEGYDSRVQVQDVIALMDQLGHDKFYLHGEDRGADYAFAVAGLHRDRVLKLSFCEMLLSGLGLEESSFWTPDNVSAQYRMDGECYNPTNIEPKALNHWIDCVQQPGALRGVLETYRSGFKNGEINVELAKQKLTIPVLTIGAPEFFGPKVQECALKFAENVEQSEIFEECGHSLALEKPQRLAKTLLRFFLGESDKDVAK
nr:soluble epoxide hydrolase [Quercus suber]